VVPTSKGGEGRVGMGGEKGEEGRKECGGKGRICVIGFRGDGRHWRYFL